MYLMRSVALHLVGRMIVPPTITVSDLSQLFVSGLCEWTTGKLASIDIT